MLMDIIISNHLIKDNNHSNIQHTKFHYIIGKIIFDNNYIFHLLKLKVVNNFINIFQKTLILMDQHKINNQMDQVHHNFNMYHDIISILIIINNIQQDTLKYIHFKIRKMEQNMQYNFMEQLSKFDNFMNTFYIIQKLKRVKEDNKKHKFHIIELMDIYMISIDPNEDHNIHNN